MRETASSNVLSITTVHVQLFRHVFPGQKTVDGKEGADIDE